MGARGDVGQMNAASCETRSTDDRLPVAGWQKPAPPSLLGRWCVSRHQRPWSSRSDITHPPNPTNTFASRRMISDVLIAHHRRKLTHFLLAILRFCDADANPKHGSNDDIFACTHIFCVLLVSPMMHVGSREDSRFLCMQDAKRGEKSLVTETKAEKPPPKQGWLIIICHHQRRPQPQ